MQKLEVNYKINDKKRKHNLFPHKRIKAHMKDFGARGFRFGVVQTTEKILYHYLEKLTKHVIIVTKKFHRIQISIEDLKLGLLRVDKKLYEDIFKSNEVD